jgi:hypothetical protein
VGHILHSTPAPYSGSFRIVDGRAQADRSED